MDFKNTKEVVLMIKKAVAMIVMGIVFFCSSTSSARGTQEKPQETVQTTNIVVMGDSLADGIWMILNSKFKGRNDIKLKRYAKASSGICRIDFYNWINKTNDLFANQEVDVLVIMLGGNDKQSFVRSKGSYVYYTDEEAWVATYEERAREVLNIIVQHDTRVIWVGLPSMRSAKMNNHALRVNSIYSRISADYGIEYVSAWDMTVDDHGRYQSNLKDASGKVRNMRAGDGVHFTTAGYTLITDVVYQKITRFLEKPKLRYNLNNRYFAD